MNGLSLNDTQILMQAAPAIIVLAALWLSNTFRPRLSRVFLRRNNRK